MLKLYDYFRSSASFRVRIALNLKNLNYTNIPVHLVKNGGEQFTDAYKKINPSALVPTLLIDDTPLSQSLAIIEYLEEMHPSPSLLPSDPIPRAKVRAFALSIACDIHPLNNLRVLTYLTNKLNVSEDNKNDWYQHWIQTGLVGLEQSLITSPHQTTFCFGDTPTLADICLAPQLYNARRFACDLTAYPTLTKIDNACQHHPAFAKAYPEMIAA